MRRWLPIVFNLCAFDALWAVTILTSRGSLWPVGPALVLSCAAAQLLLSHAPAREARVILSGAAAGVLGDAAAHTLGLWTFTPNADEPLTSLRFVAVFFALWINFGATLRPSLRWMWPRPILAAIVGAIAAPLTYWAASRLGAIRFEQPAWAAYAWIAVQYALSLPAWMWLARRWIPPAPAPARAPSSPAGTPAPGIPA